LQSKGTVDLAHAEVANAARVELRVQTAHKSGEVGIQDDRALAVVALGLASSQTTMRVQPPFFDTLLQRPRQPLVVGMQTSVHDRLWPLTVTQSEPSLQACHQ
jgi:hypothetical protein